jgi:hypothetical protein
LAPAIVLLKAERDDGGFAPRLAPLEGATALLAYRHATDLFVRTLAAGGAGEATVRDIRQSAIDADVALASDRERGAALAWTQMADESAALWTSVFDGGEWSLPATMGRFAAADEHPRRAVLAMRPGAASVVFARGGDATMPASLHAARLAPPPPGAARPFALAGERPPVAFLDAAGNLVVVTLEPDAPGAPASVRARTQDATGRWSAPLTLSTQADGAVLSGPALASDPKGRAIVAWIAGRGEHAAVIAARYETLFGAPTTVAGDAVGASELVAAAGANGTFGLAWTARAKGPATQRGVYVALFH